MQHALTLTDLKKGNEVCSFSINMQQHQNFHKLPEFSQPMAPISTMKFLVAIALIAAVASAGVIKPTQLSGELAEIQQIVAAINSPSTDPATAAALEAMLLDVMGVQPVQVVEVAQPSPIAVGPAIVEASPIAVGPAF
ncbi:putative cuticle protein CPH38, partial [Operophtera brumata]